MIAKTDSNLFHQVAFSRFPHVILRNAVTKDLLSLLSRSGSSEKADPSLALRMTWNN
jgi:hypothetical protein